MADRSDYTLDQTLNLLQTQSTIAESTGQSFDTNLVKKEQERLMQEKLKATGTITEPLLSRKEKEEMKTFAEDFAFGATNIPVKLPKSISKLSKKALGALEKVSNKIWPKMMVSKTPLGIRQPSLLAKYMERRSQKRMYDVYAAPKEFEKFKRTFPGYSERHFKKFDMQTGEPIDEYKGYLDWLKRGIYEVNPEFADLPVKSFGRQGSTMHWPRKIITPEGKPAAGAYSGALDMLKIDPELAGPVNWGTVFRHELGHRLHKLPGKKDQFGVSKPGPYESGWKPHLTQELQLTEEFSQGIRPSVSKFIREWEGLEDMHKALLGKNIDVSHIMETQYPAMAKLYNEYQYFLKPTETLARVTESKTGRGLMGRIRKALYGDVPKADLERVYTKDFTKKLMNEYWAGAPLGLGLNELIMEEE